MKPRYSTDSQYNTMYYAYSYRASSYKASNNDTTSNAHPLGAFLNNESVPVSDMTETTLTLCGLGSNSVAKLIAGSSYFLIVGAIVDE